MAEKVLIVGFASGPVWGVPDPSWGKGQSFESSLTGEKGELKDGAGRTVAIAYYDNRKELSYTIKITGTPTTFTRGMKLTIVEPVTGDTVTARLEDAKLVMSNTEFAEYQLTMIAYDNLADASFSATDLSTSL